jgi:hypothetical protein
VFYLRDKNLSIAPKLSSIEAYPIDPVHHALFMVISG